jgi:uncharacterized protein YjiK
MYKIFTLLLIFLISCEVEDSVSQPNPTAFEKTGEYQTEVLEPSGLTLDKSGKFLWTVSDNTNHAYKIDLNGNIIKELSYQGDDLEGIVYDKFSNTLWLSEEQLREFVNIDTNGNFIASFPVTNLEGSGNSGLEGITLDSSKSFFALNEKQPALFAKLDSNFKAMFTAQIPNMEDLSGIDFYSDDEFFIVSDQSQKLILWSISSGLKQEYSLDFEKAEGVAFNPATKMVYVVSDATGKLYTYRMN